MGPKLPLHPLHLLLGVSSALPIKAQLPLLLWELLGLSAQTPS